MEPAKPPKPRWGLWGKPSTEQAHQLSSTVPCYTQGTVSAQTHKRALAGLNLMNGDTQAEALVKAGYSPSTARNPARNGLSVSQCLKATAEVFPGAAPSELVQTARRVLARKLKQLDSDSHLEDVNARDVARIVEVVEKAHGHKVDGGSKDLDPRTFAERMLWLQQMAAEYKSLTGAELVGESPRTVTVQATDTEKG